MTAIRSSARAFAASLTGIATLAGDAINLLGSLGMPCDGSYVLELVLNVANLTGLLLSLISFRPDRSLPRRSSKRQQLIPVSAAEHRPVGIAEHHENGADHEQDYAYRRQDADARQPSDQQQD